MLFSLFLALVVVGCTVPPTGEAKLTNPQCKDRVDNDGDGFCDYGIKGPSCRDGSVRGDPGCSSLTDKTECTSQCTTSANCGTPAYVGSSYCGTDGNVYRDYRTYTCTTTSGCGTCNTQTTSQLQATCTNGCSTLTNKTGAYCSTPSAVCGNNVTESGEVCDQNNVDGQTCASQGFSGGILRCNADCQSFDTSGCWTNSCSDTDGGNVPLVEGTVSGSSYGSAYSYTDICYSSTKLTEHYCNGNLRTQTLVNCANNVTTTTCSNGACVFVSGNQSGNQSG